MYRSGVVGIGDMGSGLARNLIANGHEVTGIDLKEDRMQAFAALGGKSAESVAEVGRNADVVFVMVMTGAEAREVILGGDRRANAPGDSSSTDGSGDQSAEPGGHIAGLIDTLAPGSVVILSATVLPVDARKIGESMHGSGIHLVDSPVSGGFPGAQSGTLTLMAAASDEALTIAEPAMQAVSGTIHRVGT